MDLTHRIYEGSQPYLFISYAHKDSDSVLPLIRGLMDRGLRVWFDDGVEPGGVWPDHIAGHLVSSHCVVIMLSSNSLKSHNCRKEMLMANNYRKNVIVVYLEELRLPPGDEMQLIDYHALYRWKYAGDDAFLSALCRGNVMETCKSDSDRPATEETVVPISPVCETIGEMVTEPAAPAKNESAPPALSPEEAYTEAQNCFNRQDYHQAVKFARIAAHQDHPGAQYLLGCIYCRSDGNRYCPIPLVSQEHAKNLGLRWIRTAAENGYPQAQRYVGELEKDPVLAAAWFQKAADRGDTLGLYYLGECYRQGKGVEKNIVKAMDCYLAAHKTHPVSASRYREILKKASFSEKMALKKAGHNLGRLEK